MNPCFLCSLEVSEGGIRRQLVGALYAGVRYAETGRICTTSTCSHIEQSSLCDAHIEEFRQACARVETERANRLKEHAH